MCELYSRTVLNIHNDTPKLWYIIIQGKVEWLYIAIHMFSVKKKNTERHFHTCTVVSNVSRQQTYQ